MLYNIWKGCSSLIKKISELFGNISGILIGLISIIVTYNVISRFIFHKPSIWIDEVSEYSLSAITFLGVAYTLKQRKHINVDILTNYLPNNVKQYFNILTSLIGMFVCIILSYFSYKLSYNAIIMNERTWTSLRLPIGYLYLYFFIGMIVLSLQYLVNIVEDTEKIIKKA